ncbi:hypothetical protein [Reichenbachiella sp. MALMAid0571]|uniref:hypothetical protein n=1 Tax=Reichenbachiella sp. MALMAid0571 TaxID=3143939 RepID=UPI0032DE67E7
MSKEVNIANQKREKGMFSLFNLVRMVIPAFEQNNNASNFESIDPIDIRAYRKSKKRAGKNPKSKNNDKYDGTLDQNKELKRAKEELAITKIGKEAAMITLAIATVLFILSELILEPLIDHYFDSVWWLALSIKFLITISLKPIDEIAENYLANKLNKMHSVQIGNERLSEEVQPEQPIDKTSKLRRVNKLNHGANQQRIEDLLSEAASMIEGKGYVRTLKRTEKPEMKITKVA